VFRAKRAEFSAALRGVAHRRATACWRNGEQANPLRAMLTRLTQDADRTGHGRMRRLCSITAMRAKPLRRPEAQRFAGPPPERQRPASSYLVAALHLDDFAHSPPQALRERPNRRR
jgi:hypothetical protein